MRTAAKVRLEKDAHPEQTELADTLRDLRAELRIVYQRRAQLVAALAALESIQQWAQPA